MNRTRPKHRGRFRRLGRALARTWYQVRYFPFRSASSDVPAKQRGFVCIQIDSLSYDHLLLAMRKGYMRRLRRWVRNRSVTLRRFHPGLPTTTPYAQAGILFGVEQNIPGFRWYEREERRIVNCNEPSSSQYISDHIIGRRAGALEGGASYMNMLDGGARRTVFTLSATHNDSILGRMGGWNLFLLLLFHPLRILRTGFASLAELWAEVCDRWLAPEPHSEQAEVEGIFPLLRVSSNVVMREMQTFGLLMEIHAGTPYIYTTYAGYDEMAHHFGPSSRAALQNLRHIDRRIGEVRRMIRYGAGRPYDLIILSDHGQTPAIPFTKRFGRTLGADIAAAIQRERVEEVAGAQAYMGRRAQYLSDRVRASRIARFPGVTPATQALLRRLERRSLLPLVHAETVFLGAEVGAIVTYSSCLAHLYLLREEGKRLDLDEIEALHPRLLPYLRAHAGIGPLFVRADPGRWMVFEGPNRAELSGGRLERIEGLNPLRIEDPRGSYRQELWRFLCFPNVGDVVIFGRYDGKRILCFDDQVGAHGSMGGEQSRPFLLLPSSHPIAGARLRGYGAIFRDVLRPYHFAPR